MPKLFIISVMESNYNIIQQKILNQCRKQVTHPLLTNQIIIHSKLPFHSYSISLNVCSNLVWCFLIFFQLLNWAHNSTRHFALYLTLTISNLPFSSALLSSLFHAFHLKWDGTIIIANTTKCITTAKVINIAW